MEVVASAMPPVVPAVSAIAAMAFPIMIVDVACTGDPWARSSGERCGVHRGAECRPCGRLAAQLCWGGGTFRQCQLPIAARRPHNGQR